MRVRVKEENTSPIKKFFRSLGPGFITGASDDDPSGIATYSQTGAKFGYNQLWTSLFSTPFMYLIQEMCGRIGIVTGKGLSGVIKSNYSKKVLYFCIILLVIANSINIGVDLGAMASSAQLVLGINFVYLILGLTAITLALEIFVSYDSYSKYLKYLTFTLLTYILAAFIIKQNWRQIAIATLIPSFSFTKEYLMSIVAIFGTTISPYLFFWQASEEVEEEVKKKKLRSMGQGKPKFSRLDIRGMRIDTLAGMIFSNIIMFFIIITAASTLGVHGITNIQTADQAAQALKPIAGNFAYLLFAIGIIGTGMLAIPILAGSASYALAEAFNWKEGLYNKFRKAHGFYGIITLSTLVGLMINFTPIPIFKMLYYTAILNGIVAPPLMIIILLISNNKKIMGNHTNSRIANMLGWTITLLMILVILSLIVVSI